MSIGTSAFFFHFTFAWSTYFQHFTSSLWFKLFCFNLLGLKWVSCGQHIYASWFFSHSTSLCLLFGALNPFTFKVIINTYVPMVNLLIVFGLLSFSSFFFFFSALGCWWLVQRSSFRNCYKLLWWCWILLVCVSFNLTLLSQSCFEFHFKLKEGVMDREAWRAAIHGVTKSRAQMNDWIEMNWTESSKWQYIEELLTSVSLTRRTYSKFTYIKHYYKSART